MSKPVKELIMADYQRRFAGLDDALDYPARLRRSNEAGLQIGLGFLDATLGHLDLGFQGFELSLLHHQTL